MFPGAEKGKTGGEEWNIFGGHRLWHAPEVMPRTYFPDNYPVDYTWDGITLKLVQQIESTTGIVKEIDITLDPDRNHVKILHRLINKKPFGQLKHPHGPLQLMPEVVRQSCPRNPISVLRMISCLHVL